MQLQIRKCVLSDLDELIEISRSTFIIAFEKENNPEDFKNYIDTAFSEEQLKSELLEEDSHFFFAFLGQDLVAYLKLNTNKAQNELQESNGLELERIYVLAAYQGKNIGAALLKSIEEIALELNKRYIWLGVWEHNPKAIRFYEKHGYTKFDTHLYLIGNDKQTDWLMRKNL